MSCQMVATKSWNSFHIDLKTAFLQGQSYDVSRDVVCQLPPEAGHPPHIAARVRSPAYGMNDAARRWWNILDQALCSSGMIHTRTDRCCYVLYSIQSRERTWKQWGQSTIAQKHGTNDVLTGLRERSEMDAAFEKKKKMDPTEGSPLTGKSAAGILNPLLDDLFGTGGNEMEQRVLIRLRPDFQVGSEDWNDVTCTGQRIRWIQAPRTGSFIEVGQENAMEESEGSQWNEIHKKTSNAHVQCCQGTEAFWDR